MKKLFYSMLMLCAMFTTTNVSAQETKVLMQEDFTTDFGQFTLDGDPIFYVMSEELRVKAAYNNATAGKTTYLISPELETGTTTTVTFRSKVSWSAYGIADKSGLFVKKSGDAEWTKLEGVQYPEDTFFGDYVPTEIVLPAEYDNQKINVAFGYTVDDPNAQEAWHIDDFKITTVISSTPNPEPEPEPTPGEESEIYSVVFDTQSAVDSWTVEGFLADDPEFKTLHKFGMQLNSYLTQEKELKTSYVVSPVITLGSENNVASFTHANMEGQDLPIEDLTGFAVREEGGAWTELEIPNRTIDYSNFVNSGDIIVPAEFNGKNVQFAFKYVWDGGNNTCFWWIKDFKVVGSQVSTSIDCIENVELDVNAPMFNVAGQKVNASYKGIVLQNGKKFFNK